LLLACSVAVAKDPLTQRYVDPVGDSITLYEAQCENKKILDAVPAEFQEGMLKARMVIDTVERPTCWINIPGTGFARFVHIIDDEVREFDFPLGFFEPVTTKEI
jgi:hypothetical protein